MGELESLLAAVPPADCADVSSSVHRLHSCAQLSVNIVGHTYNTPHHGAHILLLVQAAIRDEGHEDPDGW